MLAVTSVLAGFCAATSHYAVDVHGNAQPQRPLPAKRFYDTHHYYAVETRSTASIDPQEVAELLGAEFVERVGELQHHWLIRSKKSFSSETTAKDATVKRSSSAEASSDDHDDPVIARWQHISRSRHFSTHGLSKRQHHAALSIRDVEKQVLRRRHKRDVIYSPWDTPHLYPKHRAPIPGPEPHPYPDPLPRPPPLPDSNIVKVANAMKIHDPIFPEQWHLVNDKKIGNDLNVSGVWSQNITGRGVTVALIDDGVDMHSPDLTENFVSTNDDGSAECPSTLSHAPSSSRSFPCSSPVGRTISTTIPRFQSHVSLTTSMALDAPAKLLPFATTSVAWASLTMLM